MRTVSQAVRLAAFFGVLLACRNLLAQNPVAPLKGDVELSKPAPIGYPSLARQSRISGEVQVEVEVRRDGAVNSVTVMKGHPLLAPAALESAKNSKFECRNCSEEGLSYRLVFTFEISFEPEPCPGEKAPNPAERPFPRVSQSGNHVTATERSRTTCDPTETITKTKVRSAKCWYLWRCGWRVETPL